MTVQNIVFNRSGRASSCFREVLGVEDLPFQAVGFVEYKEILRTLPGDDFKVQKAKFAGSRSRVSFGGLLWRRLSVRTQES